MNSPPTTHSSRRRMTSKIRFLCDGAEGVHPQCYFSQLSFPVHSPLGPLKPSPGATHLAFRPQSDHSRQDHHRRATTVQLLTKMQSICPSIYSEPPTTSAHVATYHFYTRRMISVLSLRFEAFPFFLETHRWSQSLSSLVQASTRR